MDIRPAFPGEPTGEQIAALAAARPALDEMTCCTIHSFCRVLLADAGLEAGVDPSAEVADRDTSDEILETVLRRHLRERLARAIDPRNVPVAALLADPNGVVQTLRTVVLRLRARCDLVPPEAGDGGIACLRDRVRAFRAFLDGCGCTEPFTRTYVSAFEDQLAGLLDVLGDDEADGLVRVARMGPPERCATDEGAFRA